MKDELLQDSQVRGNEFTNDGHGPHLLSAGTGRRARGEGALPFLPMCTIFR